MNTVTDCKTKLSEVLQTGQVCHRFIGVTHLTQHSQFAFALDGRIAQATEHRRVRTLPILDHDASTDVGANAIETPKAHQAAHGGLPRLVDDKSSYSNTNETDASQIPQQSRPRATGRSQNQQQSQPTLPQGDWRSHPDTKSTRTFGTGPSSPPPPYPPSYDGNRYGPTGTTQIQQQPRQQQPSALPVGGRNGYPPCGIINVPGTSSVRQQPPPAQPWVDARQQHGQYGSVPNPAVSIAAGGGTASHHAFPTAGPTGPFTVVVNNINNVDNVNMTQPMAAATPANWSHRKRA